LQVWRGTDWTSYPLHSFAPVGPPSGIPFSSKQQEPALPATLRSPDPHHTHSQQFSGGKSFRPTAQAILTCHYSLTNGTGVPGDDLKLLDKTDLFRSIPAIAIHGRQDIVCPIQAAYDLHQAWPEMELQVLPGSGHSMYESSITHAIVNATDRMFRVSAALN
jgi:pimeloyl-ACP methyl ester carboxylesterase